MFYLFFLVTKISDRTSSDDKDSPLSYMKDLITREEERLDSDTKCVSVEDKKDIQKPHKNVYTTNTVGLFPLYIPKPQSLTYSSDLYLLERYQIFPSLNPELYSTNCFLYALSQYRVSIGKIVVLRPHIANIYIKTKEMGLLCKKTRFVFIMRQHIDRKSRLDNTFYTYI